MEDLQNKIIELMDLFDDEQVTTADKIDRPQRALDREAIDDFMKRNPMAGGGMLVQPSADGSRPGYAGNIGQEKVSKGVSESSKKINKNINKWATNWFNKNQKNYGVRDFKKIQNDFATAWSKELTENSKKYEGYGVTKKTLKMSNTGLPIIKDGISIDGIKFVTRADRAGNNPDLAWERLFYKNKLKNKDFKTQLKQYVEWATANKKKNPGLLDPNVKFGSAAQSKIGTLEYGKKFKGFNDDVIFFMGDVLNKKSLNPGGTITGVTDIFKKTLGKDADNYFKKFKGSWNVWVDNFKTVGKLAGLDDSMIDALLKKQTSDTQKIMKLYNVENLPLEFKVAQDHLFGLAEAKALGDPKIAAQTLKNLVASTREQNRVLGQEGFSNKRVSLIKKFKNASLENKANIATQLNVLAEEYVPGRLQYDVKKDGSLKITNLQPETTLKAKTEAYKNLAKDFPKPLYQKLMKFCPKSNGGEAGVCTLEEAMDGLVSESKQLQSGNMNEAQAKKTAQKIRAVTRVGTGTTLSGLLGPYGLAGEVVIDGAIMANNMLDSGDTYKEALSKSLIKYAMPKDARERLEKETDLNTMILGSDTSGLAANYADALKKDKDLQQKYKNYLKVNQEDVSSLDDPYSSGSTSMFSVADKNKAQRELIQALTRAEPTYGKSIYQIAKFGSPEQQAFAAKQEVFDAKKMQNRMDYDKKILGPLKDLFGTGFYSPEQLKQLELKADRDTELIGQMSEEDKMQNLMGGAANFAGGGIAGLSGGDPKGAMLESMNPDSQGLLSLMKRARNY